MSTGIGILELRRISRMERGSLDPRAQWLVCVLSDEDLRHWRYGGTDIDRARVLADVLQHGEWVSGSSAQGTIYPRLVGEDIAEAYKAADRGRFYFPVVVGNEQLVKEREAKHAAREVTAVASATEPEVTVAAARGLQPRRKRRAVVKPEEAYAALERRHLD